MTLSDIQYTIFFFFNVMIVIKSWVDCGSDHDNLKRDGKLD